MKITLIDVRTAYKPRVYKTEATGFSLQVSLFYKDLYICNFFFFFFLYIFSMLHYEYVFWYLLF